MQFYLVFYSWLEHLKLPELEEGRKDVFGVPPSESLLLAPVVGFLIMRKGESIPVGKRVERLKKQAESRQEAIVAKCHPATFEIAKAWKESIEAMSSLGPNPPTELASEVQSRFGHQLDEIQRKYSGPTPPGPNRFAAQIIFSDAALKSQSDNRGVAEWLHFERHRTPLKVDANKRQAKDFDASRRILRTAADLEALRCGKKLKKFKGDLEHRNMFEVLWGFGVETLTPEELVVFFDSYCPCGIEVHDPDALKKSRNRFKLVLRRATAQTNPS